MARILVVEDDTHLAEAVAELLNTSGHDTRAVNDARAALAEAARLAPDCVIFDVGLPWMDGIALAEALRSQYDGHIGLVALTAHDDEPTLEKLQVAGVGAILVKPAMLDDILDAIERSFRSRRADDASPIEAAGR